MTTTDRENPCRSCEKGCTADHCPKYQQWLRRAEKWLHGMTYDGLPGSMLHEVKKGKGPV